MACHPQIPQNERGRNAAIGEARGRLLSKLEATSTWTPFRLGWRAESILLEFGKPRSLPSSFEMHVHSRGPN